MDKVELKILGISSGHTSASYTLILEEKGGGRKLPIVIGAAEAQSIAVQIEGIKPVRPMTHDLMKSLLDSLGAKIDEVMISKLDEGIFYADLFASGATGSFNVDARTSDAIAMAIRYDSPIFTTPEIMLEAGIELTEQESEQISRNLESEEEEADLEVEEELLEAIEESTDIQKMSTEELEDLLKRAIEEEDYASAAKIRDEIQSRQNN